MDLNSKAKEELVTSVKSSARWFEVEITLRLFGVEVWHAFFPPKKNVPM